MRNAEYVNVHCIDTGSIQLVRGVVEGLLYEPRIGISNSTQAGYEPAIANLALNSIVC